MLSLTLRYGLSAAVLLASREGSPDYVKVRALSRMLSVPHSVLAKTLQQLGAAGMVDSLRGPHGGCRWKQSALDVTVADLARALDAMPSDPGCLMGPLALPGGRCLIPELSATPALDAMEHLTIGMLVARFRKEGGSVHLN